MFVTTMLKVHESPKRLKHVNRPFDTKEIIQ